MAKAPAKKTPAAEPERVFAIGDFVTFNGYGDPQPPEPYYEEGEVLEIIGFKDDDPNAFLVRSVISKLEDTCFASDEISEYATQEAVDAAFEAAGDDGASVGAEEETAEEEVVEEEAPAQEPVRQRGAAKPTTAKSATKPAEAPAKASAKASAKATAPADTKPAAKATAPAKAATKPAATGKATAPAKAAAKQQLAKAAEKRTKAAEPEAIEIIDTEAVTEILTEAGDALEAAQMLVKRAETSYYTLGGVLLHVEAEGLYKTAGYDGKTGFTDYVKTELGMEYRHMRTLMQMYAHFTKLGVSEDTLLQVGWTKARELLAINNAKHIEAAISYGAEHTREELVEHIRSKYVKADKSAGRKTATDKPERVKQTTFKFSLSGAEADMTENALARAKEMIGTESLNEAFRQIITEWSQTHGGLDIDLEDALVAVENRYGVRLGLLDENGALVEQEVDQEAA